MSVMKLHPIISSFRARVRAAYGLDLRSLALFRILVAIVLLMDLSQRLQHASTFYSDSGALTRRTAISLVSTDRWSLAFMSGSTEFASALLLIGIVAAFFLLVGYRTRTAIVVLWVVLFSIQTRNNYLLSAADTLIRVSLFWGIFLPLGARWSVDTYLSTNREEPESTRPNKIASVATFALILQSACVYLFTAIQKDGVRWREDGMATYYALGARDFSTAIGEWLFQTAPEVFFQFFTYSTMLIEFAVPIMLLLPLKSDFLRGLAVALVVALQIGIAMTMTVGLFPFISIASILAILPGGVWDTLQAWLRGWAQYATFKQRFVDLANTEIPDREKQPALPSSPQLAPEIHVSQLNKLVPRHFTGTQPNPRFLVNAFCLIAVVVTVLWNVTTVSSYELPTPIKRFATVTGLYQNWSMFAPNPQRSSIWYVFDGTLASGEKVDLLPALVKNDASMRTEPVWDQSDGFVTKDKYWRKYLNSVRSYESAFHSLARYTCRSWNGENSGQDRLVSFTITRAYARTLPNSERGDPVFDRLLSWNCG